MLQSIFATKIGMTQVWDTKGHRFAVTKCKFTPNVVLGIQNQNSDKLHQDQSAKMYIIGYGQKKLKNVSKPLQTKIKQSGFSFGVSKMKGVFSTSETELSAGTVIGVDQVVKVGDVVAVRGVSRGRGFAGGVKRYGFHGGPKTHGQSDRERAIGSIAAGTTPGHIFKGKRMPGHYGVETITVKGLIVLHIDNENQEIWLSGPVPGSKSCLVQISPIGENQEVKLDLKASNITEPKVEAQEENKPTEVSEVEESK